MSTDNSADVLADLRITEGPPEMIGMIPDYHRAEADRRLRARDQVAELRRQNDDLRAEIDRLKRDGTPGVMHAIDRAFLDLAIKERDYWRHRAGE